MAQITYTDKVDISTSPVAAINKVVADDMNEIKTVVNTNDTLRGDLTTLNTTSKTSVVSAINEVNNNSVYSSSEIAVGTWIDGKTIYRKVIYISSVPNGTYISQAHSISNMDEIVKLSGIMRNPNNHIATPLNMYGTSGLYSGNTVVFRVDRTNVYIACNTNYSDNVAYIVIEYTKTS